MVDKKAGMPPIPHWVGFSPDGKVCPDTRSRAGSDRDLPSGCRISQRSFRTWEKCPLRIPGGGPRHMRFSIDGKFIYLLNELSLSVTTFAWDAQKGTAKRLTTTPAISEEVKAGESFNSSAEILVHPERTIRLLLQSWS